MTTPVMLDPAPDLPRATPSARAFYAYVGPFALFLVLQALPGLLKNPAPTAPWWLHTPEFWVYPLQTLACAVLMLWYRRYYPRSFSPLAALFALLVGAVVFALWISPQAFFGFSARLDGFDPTPLAADPLAYHLTVGLRFARLVLVVPWLEEIFWRGFLLRYLIRENFLSLPFGSWTWLSFGIVVLGFTFEHGRPDWPAAFVTGLLYNLVAIRTRSLPACVLAHALTNLLLGGYVMHTRQWGFW